MPKGYWQDFLHAHHRKFTEVVCAGKVKELRWSLVDFALRRLGEKLGNTSPAVLVALVEEKWPVTLGEATQSAEPVRTILFEQRLIGGVLK